MPKTLTVQIEIKRVGRSEFEERFETMVPTWFLSSNLEPWQRFQIEVANRSGEAAPPEVVN